MSKVQEEIKHLNECKYLGNDAWDCGHVDNSEECDCHVCKTSDIAFVGYHPNTELRDGVEYYIDSDEVVIHPKPHNGGSMCSRCGCGPCICI